MQVARRASSPCEQDGSPIGGATRQQTRWWETTYTTVCWDYPPSPAAYYDALLTRGASHSRFLRIAYLSTRPRFPSSPPCSPLSSPSFSNPLDTHSNPHFTSTTPSTPPDGPHRKPGIHLPPTPPYPLTRSCVSARPRSANPTSHTLKRRKPQWPKPPHYHAALLRSPLSHRKGLFRAVLPPNKAVDFFRWDALVGAGVSSHASRREHDWIKSNGDVGPSSRVAESVLEPYEAAAGFFGWKGLGSDVAWRLQEDDRRCWRELHLDQEGAGSCGSSTLRFEVDEAVVDEGKVRWARTAEELVGPPGLALRSGKVTSPAHKDARPMPSVSPVREEVRWDMGSSASHLPKVTSVSGEKRPSPLSSSSPTFKVGHRSDSLSPWHVRPSPYRGPPPASHVPSVRFLPPPTVQYGPPPVQFSPWFPGGRVGSAQGHGYWYGGHPVGASTSVARDPHAKALPPHPHVFATPVTPISSHPSKPIWDEYGPGHDDKENDTDHGYESTTTTTDSDPPPHTPVGAATTSHCVEALQLHGDDEIEVHGVEMDNRRAAASMTIRLSDPSTPAKLLDRFSGSASPPLSSGSPDARREGCESSKGAVVFPSLNGSFCQVSALALSSPGISAQTTPAGTVTPISSSSTKVSTKGYEEDFETNFESTGVEVSSVSGDGPALMLSLCSPPLTSPRPDLGKDSQGLWEPLTLASPSSSSSSLPLSPSEGKTGSRPAVGRIGDKTVTREGSESPEAASSPSTLSAKSKSSSPSLRRVTSAGSIRSSTERPALFTPPPSASESVFSGSYTSSPSPPNGASSPPNPTTLLPAFLATANVKRKKGSRTREIVDRLRSSSIDAGKGDNLGWLAGLTGGEAEGKLSKTSIGSDPNHASGSPLSSLPPGSESGSWVRSEKGHEAQGSKMDVGPSKGSGTTQANSEGRLTHASSKAAMNPGITPFPILSVSPSQTSNFTMVRQNQTSASARESLIATSTKSAEGSKMNMNVTVATSPIARNSGLPLVPNTPISGTSPSTRTSHHPLPSPSHLTVHPTPALGPPPPMLTVSGYPHPVYVPFPQYHVAPAHQGQQGQGTWVAVYPGRPPHVPVHPIPAPITGVSGMRHVSW